MSEPHWILTALVGAAFGYAIPLGIAFSIYLVRRFSKDYLVRKWYGYHWSFLHKKPELIRSNWEIKKGIIHKYKAVVHIKTETASLNYSGQALVESDQLVVQLSAKEHDEHAAFRFKKPIATTADSVAGAWLSFDHDSVLSAGAAVLSIKELSDAQVIALLGKEVWIDRAKPLIRVRK